MVWINKDVHLNRKVDIKIDFDAEFKLKTYEDYINDNYFYKLGKLYESLIGTKFMCFDGDVLLTKTIVEIKFDSESVCDENRKKYVEGKFISLNESPMKNDYTGYKLIVYVVGDDGRSYNINDVYLIPQ